LVLEKGKKSEVVDNFKTHAKDTGSSVVQIALLTERINQLSEHLLTHKRDFHSRRGLLMMIGARRRHLSYLKKTNAQKYDETIKKLNIRK
jgi:small subunit ribosomal protein S15